MKWAQVRGGATSIAVAVPYDRLREAQEQGWLGEVAAIEASLAAAEQELAAMRDFAARHTTVHLGMPNFRSVVARIDSEQPNKDAKQHS